MFTPCAPTLLMQDLIPLVDVTAKVVKEHDAW